jgi:hypothetical protein
MRANIVFGGMGKFDVEKLLQKGQVLYVKKADLLSEQLDHHNSPSSLQKALGHDFHTSQSYQIR